MIPPAGFGCLAQSAIKQHYLRQKQRRVANGSTPRPVSYIWSLAQPEEMTPVLPFAAQVPHWPTGSRRTTTKEPRVHKECTGYPQTVHIRQERPDEWSASNNRFEGESSCSASSSARNWHEQARQVLTNRCRFHPRSHFANGCLT